MTRKQRNELLVSMTDEVAELCLRDNYLQTQSITVTQTLGVHLLDRLARFMRSLEKEGRLDREIEFLPDDDTLAERFQRKQGLTRPEIAVLLSYAKIVLYDELVDSDLTDDPCMMPALLSYFPERLREQFEEGIGKHRLRREIVATVLTNDIVNRVGVTFVHEVKEKTGMPADEIARAYVVAREISGMRVLWKEIEALDLSGGTNAQTSLLTECGRLLERSTVWLLRNAAHPIDVQAELDTYTEGARELAARLDEVLTEDSRTALEARAQSLIERGAPPELAQRVARLRKLEPTGDIVRIAQAAEVDVQLSARTYFRIGHRFGFNWLGNAAALLPSDTAWDKLAVTALVDDLYGTQADLAEAVLEDAGREGDPIDVIEEWAEHRRPQVARSEQLLGELQSMSQVNLAMLAVASRQLKSMIS
jgi:glutamate dehydrogenase